MKMIYGFISTIYQDVMLYCNAIMMKFQNDTSIKLQVFYFNIKNQNEIES